MGNSIAIRDHNTSTTDAAPSWRSRQLPTSTRRFRLRLPVAAGGDAPLVELAVEADLQPVGPQRLEGFQDQVDAGEQEQADARDRQA